MKKILYILLFVSFGTFAQHEMMLRASQAQFANEGGGVIYDEDYQAILDEATSLSYTLPSSTEKEIQNQIIINLKANGVWSSIDCIYYFKGDGGTNFKLINWKNPTGTKATQYDSNIWSSSGVKGNKESYLNLPHTKTNWVIGNCAFTIEVTTGFVDNNGLIDKDLPLNITNANTFQYFGNDGISSRYVYDFSGTGVFGINQKSSSTMQGCKNGIWLDEATGKTIDADYTGTLQLFNTGGGGYRSDATVGFIAFGGNYNQTNFYNSF